MGIRRVLKGAAVALLALIGALVIALTGAIALDPVFSPHSVEAVANVEYRAADGSALRGYLAQPAGAGPHPAVIMIHEWWGLNADIVEMADRLAAEGYVVLAPDAYRGQVTGTVPRALWLRITTPDERIAADVDAAYAYLLSLEEVDAERTAALGFCFGGGQSLRMGIRHPELAATVILYGDLVSDPAEFGALIGGGPLLGIYGAEDASIPLAQVEAFEAALVSAGVAHRITVYPNVGHAFVQPDAIDQPGAAHDAWQEILTFLAETVGPLSDPS